MAVASRTFDTPPPAKLADRRAIVPG